jgi:hypothetical protein
MSDGTVVKEVTGNWVKLRNPLHDRNDHEHAHQSG